MIFKKLHINDPLCLNRIQEGDRFAGPQFESPTASMLNQLMWGNIEEGNFGVVFHLPYFGNLKAGKAPGSFYHASMRTSDPMFIRKHTQKMERNISVGLNVGLIIGSKTTLNSNAGEGQEAVSCESCYPVDADSDRFRDTSLASPNGTSCSPFQREEPNGALCHNGACLTSIQKNCMCNYESVPGAHYADYLLRIPESIVHQFDDWYHRHSCWYPQTSRGVQEMVAASNSVFLNRKSFHGYVSPWTECSCSRNVMAREMSDAIVIILPPNKTSLCSLSIRDLQYIQRQLRILYRQKYSSIPIIIMQQTKGIDKEECAYLWEGIKCNEGYRKVLFSQTYYFPDGTCIARRKQDAERFYIGNTAECTSLKQKQVADERDASSYLLQPSNRTENSQTQESRSMLVVGRHTIGKSQANVLFLSVMGLLNWFVLVYFRRQILRFVGVSAKEKEGKQKKAAAFKNKIRQRDGNSWDETTNRKARNCGFRLKPRECIWISLAASFFLIIRLNMTLHHKLLGLTPEDTLWNKGFKTHSQAEKSLNVVELLETKSQS